MSTSTSTTFTANGHLNGNSNRNRSRSRSRNRNPNPNTNGHESGDGKDHDANAKRGTSLPEPVPSNKSAGPACWSADNSGKSGRGGENAVKGGEKKEDWDGDGEGLASISGLKRGGEEERPGNGDGNGGSERHGVGKKTSSQGRRSFSRRARSRIKGHANQKLSSAPDSLGRRAEATAAAEGIEMDGEKETLLSLFFQPRRERIEGWMDSFWKRHAVLVVVPCLIVRPFLTPSLSNREDAVELTFSLLLRLPGTPPYDRSGYGSPSRSLSQIRTKARIKAEETFG